MDIAGIEELIKVLESSGTEEISVRKGDMSVAIRKGSKPKAASSKRKTRAGEAKAVARDESHEQLVLAPMVGVFHTVDGIATVGSRICAGQVGGTLESMKLLNDVVSRISGVVIEVLVEEGTPVEYGQPLSKIQLES